MDIATAKKCLNAIENSTHDDLRSLLMQSAVKYARIRTDWYLSSSSSRQDMDRHRTALHNAFIDSVNILSRNMRKAGEDTSWREQLGADRKVIGDFACYIHCLLGIRAR